MEGVCLNYVFGGPRPALCNRMNIVTTRPGTSIPACTVACEKKLVGNWALSELGANRFEPATLAEFGLYINN